MKYLAISGGLVFAVLSSAASGAQHPPQIERTAQQAPAKEADRQGRANKTEQATRDTPLRIETVESPDQTARRRAAEEEARQDKEEERRDRQRANTLSLVQIIFGLIGSAVVVATLVYTARATKAARDSAKHAGDALKHTVDAAQAALRSADAAEGALDLSRHQFSSTNRPWITIEPGSGFARNVHLGGEAEGKDRAYFYANFENIGNLPATNFRVSIKHRVDPAKDWSKWSEHDDEPPGVILAPKRSVTSTMIWLDKEAYDTVLAGKRVFQIRAEARYEDPLSGKSCTTIFIYATELMSRFEEANQAGQNGVSYIPIEGHVMT